MMPEFPRRAGIQKFLWSSGEWRRLRHLLKMHPSAAVVPSEARNPSFFFLVVDQFQIWVCYDYHVTVPQQVAHFLQTHKPSPYCDTCIQSALKLKRHQQVQQATSGGAASGGFIRVLGLARHVGKTLSSHTPKTQIASAGIFLSFAREGLPQSIEHQSERKLVESFWVITQKLYNNQG